MRYRITVSDYSSDWALKERYLEPKSRPGYLSREEVIASYEKLGVDGVELNHMYWDDCSPADLKRLAADAGLPMVSYGFFADLALSPAYRRPVVAQVFSLLDRTAELGALLAFIIPATVKDGVPLEEQRAWLVDGLRECAERAQSLGVTLVAENIDYPPTRPLMGRGADCRDMCAEVNSPAFRLIYDVAAPVFVGDESLATLRDMAPYLAHVHLKNSRPLAPGERAERYLDSVSGQRYTGTVLDGGVVNLRPILAELDRLGYGGYLLIEYQGEEDPRKALSHNVEYLRRLMDSGY